MKLSDFWKERKAHIMNALTVLLFFFVFLINNYMDMLRTKRDYETQIEELKELVQVSNIGDTPEKEFDIYQTAEEFLTFYYGVSTEISAGYRTDKLKELMTERAYAKYDVEDYDNTLNYTMTLTNIHIYVDYQASSKEGVYACIFYDENIDWTGVNTITLKKYWTGIFIFDYLSEKWLVEEITDCQELLTREEFNFFNADTNGSIFEEDILEGDGENTDIKEKK